MVTARPENERAPQAGRLNEEGDTATLVSFNPQSARSLPAAAGNPQFPYAEVARRARASARAAFVSTTATSIASSQLTSPRCWYCGLSQA